eukprot:CAMPEP_0175799094 /NCGR_PEP_ID=MMETSP0097-20121207/86314_1 /TAXON_ID=311494 /ORGANISM="Alexandrium monilatum, Strain CCMP3105" /LENGTH=48 /DNA_ID= /DNA_START= /DNA_END= /DNA_ORIENTATION=
MSTLKGADVFVWMSSRGGVDAPAEIQYPLKGVGAGFQEIGFCPLFSRA